jgi:integrase
MKNKVKLVNRVDRGYVMRWEDPLTGKQREKTLKCDTYEEAQKLCERQQNKLDYDDEPEAYEPTWEEFRERFELERYCQLRPGSCVCYDSSLDLFEKLMKPYNLNAINSAVIGHFKAKLYDREIREATVSKHLRVIKLALRWGEKAGMLKRMPNIEMPKRIRGMKLMKGRPITDAEFQNMLEVLPQVVKAHEVPEWEFYLRGLWASGLRLMEACNLYWDRLDRIRIELKPVPLLYIPGELQKNRCDQICPIAPEFKDLLETVPEAERIGHVFKLQIFTRIRPEDWKTKISNIGVQIGRAAKILVAKDVRTGKTKYATLHDLRRTFATRWARKVSMEVLQKLMRHENPATTMNYYVGENAANMYKVLEESR